MATNEMGNKQVIIDLRTILDTLEPILCGQSKTELYGYVAGRLSAIASKDPPWNWRYIQSVGSGSVIPGVKFVRAVSVLVAAWDGLPLWIGNTEPIQVYAAPGQVQPNSIILGKSRQCVNPSCRISFVPAVPNQTHCPEHTRRKKRLLGIDK